MRKINQNNLNVNLAKQRIVCVETAKAFQRNLKLFQRSSQRMNKGKNQEFELMLEKKLSNLEKSTKPGNSLT